MWELITSISSVVFADGTSLYLRSRKTRAALMARRAYRMPMQLRGPWPNISRPNLLGAFSGKKFSGSKTAGFLKFFSSLNIVVFKTSNNILN